MPLPTLAALNALARERLHWVIQPLEISPGVGLDPSIPRLIAFEDAGGFFFDPSGEALDPICDDLAMWIRAAQGLVVIVGCCHAGLIHTLRFVRTLSGDSRVLAVLGGFHLRDARAERLDRTLECLTEIGFGLVVPCHCSGDGAIERLLRTLGDRVQPGAGGASYALGRGRQRSPSSVAIVNSQAHQWSGG